MPQLGRTAIIFALTWNAANPSEAHADWGGNGVPVYPAGDFQDAALVAPDAFGGAFIFWRDGRDYATNEFDAYLQHLTPSGVIAPGWPSEGRPIVTAPRDQDPLVISPDGFGGVFVSWTDPVGPGADCYVQRVLSDGTLAPGWPAGGVLVAPATQFPKITGVNPDGNGGAYIAWNIDVPFHDILVQHLTASGQVAPGWPIIGRPIVEAPGTRSFAVLTPSESETALAFWRDSRNGGCAFVTKIGPGPEPLTGWPAEGVALQVVGTATEVGRIVSDGAGGAFVGWNDRRVGGPLFNPFYYDIYAQHVLGTGVVDPTWPANGLPICTAPSGQYDFDMAPDGAGGAYFLWEDFRNDFWQTFALRVHADGSLPPGWKGNGNLVSDQLTSQIHPRAAEDGSGGLYATWVQFPPPDQNYEIIGQHLQSDGSIASGWVPAGLPIASSSEYIFDDQYVCPDGLGGLLLAYEAAGPTFTRAYAQRVEAEHIIATSVSLIDVNARVNGVLLRWESSDAARATFTVYRREKTSDWVKLGSPHVVGTRILEFEDRDVLAGRYAYRLGYSDTGRELFSPEAWVDVEGGATLALGGFVPNPAVGHSALAFSLPDDRPARIEVYDVRGRTVMQREVGELGRGQHLLRLAGNVEPRAGVYWIRLTHPTRQLTIKGVIARAL
jgi:hypothetical protein